MFIRAPLTCPHLGQRPEPSLRSTRSQPHLAHFSLTIDIKLHYNADIFNGLVSRHVRHNPIQNLQPNNTNKHQQTAKERIHILLVTASPLTCIKHSNQSRKPQQVNPSNDTGKKRILPQATKKEQKYISTKKLPTPTQLGKLYHADTATAGTELSSPLSFAFIFVTILSHKPKHRIATASAAKKLANNHVLAKRPIESEKASPYITANAAAPNRNRDATTLLNLIFYVA